MDIVFYARNYSTTNAVLAALDSAECAMTDSQVLETSIANVAASQDKGHASIVLARDLDDYKELGLFLCKTF